MEHKKYYYYNYDPSMVAAIVFIALFALQSIWHAFVLLKTKTWFFIPFLIGAIFEVIGYAGRAINANQSPNWTLGPYIIQTLFILLGPALFAASIYMVLGRIIRLTDADKYSLIRPRWLTKAIVSGDVISFFMQAAGGGVLATKRVANNEKIGEDIIVAGLFVQIVFFGFFIVLAGLFHYRIERGPTLRSRTLSVPWKRQLYVLYAASVLIMIRSIFRAIEYIQGQHGLFLSSEAYLYGFDSALMFLVLLLFSIWHPADVISKDVREKAIADSEARIKEEGAVEHKSLRGERF